MTSGETDVKFSRGVVPSIYPTPSEEQLVQKEKQKNASTILFQSRIADRKGKNAFQLSKRKLNPTTKSSSYHSKIIRWKEAFDACSVIHGGLLLRADPVIEGMVDTLNSKFRTKQVSNVILNSKSKLPNSLKSEIGINWLKSFNKSEENKLKVLKYLLFSKCFGKTKIFKFEESE